MRTVVQLKRALIDGSVQRVLLLAGTYAFTKHACSDQYGQPSALCIDRDVTIEASVAGRVVLHAMRKMRVLSILSGTTKLLGLSITGGYVEKVGMHAARLQPITSRSLCSLP